MKKDTHWLVTLLLQLKINSVPYILKFIFYCAIVVIIHIFSTDFVSKALSVLTYVAGICIDSYFMNKQINTENKIMESMLFVYEVLMWVGTVALIVLLVKVAIDSSFVNGAYFPWCNVAVNVFVGYATTAPLIEAILNCNGNQLMNKMGEKV